MLYWLGRLEAWCAAQPAGSVYLRLHNEFKWLRAAIHRTVPGAYAPGTCVDDILRALQGLPHSRPVAYAPGPKCHEFPQYIPSQM